MARLMHSPSHTDALVLELWHGEVWAECPSTEWNLCELYCSMVSSSVQLGFRTVIIQKRFKPFPAVLVLLFKKYSHYHCVGNTIHGPFKNVFFMSR